MNGTTRVVSTSTPARKRIGSSQENGLGYEHGDANGHAHGRPSRGISVFLLCLTVITICACITVWQILYFTESVTIPHQQLRQQLGPLRKNIQTEQDMIGQEWSTEKIYKEEEKWRTQWGQLCGPSISSTRAEGHECRLVSAPTVKRRLQCCCFYYDPGELRPSSWSPFRTSSKKKFNEFTCLPNFVIIGAQKSGSTALAGYMAMHPNVLPPQKKEAHFFDARVYNGAAVHRYLRLLAPFHPNLPSPMLHDKEWSREWIKNNSNRIPQLVTSADFSSMDRTTSNFVSFEATPAYILGIETPKRMKEFIPDSKLLLVLRDPVDRAYSEYQMKLRRVQRQENGLKGVRTDGFKTVLNCHDSLSKNGEKKLEIQPLFDCIMSDDAFRSAFKVRSNAQRHLSLCICDHQALRRPQQSCNVRPEEDELKSCLRDVQPRVEFMYPLNILSTEARKISQDCVEDDRFMWGTKNCYPSGSNSNIVRDYVARGIYMAQITHWLKYYSADQLLVIADEDLKQQPRQTLKKIFKFVDVPELNPSSLDKITQDEVDKLLELLYPNFISTGWQMHSQYDKMTDVLQARLTSFYTPHNAALYKFLGRDLGWKRDVAMQDEVIVYE